jgi:hypothetical protein
MMQQRRTIWKREETTGKAGRLSTEERFLRQPAMKMKT